MFARVKKLAVSVLAILAVGTISAAMALAEGEFTAESYPVTLKGIHTTENIFKVGAVKSISCGEATLSGSLAEAAETVQMSPSYGKCIALPGSHLVTYTNNGCTYTWKVSSVAGTTANETAALDCPAGKEMEIYTYLDEAGDKAGEAKCTYTVGPQSFSGSIESHLKNVGTSSEDIALTFNLSGITTKVVKGTPLLCGAGAGNHASSTYIGEITLSASKGAESIGLMTGIRPKFTASAYPSSLSGIQTVQHAFSAGLKEVECTETTFPATLTAASFSLTLAPEYKGCRTELNLPTTVTLNGCSFTLHSEGTTTIDCPAGKKIEYHIYETEKKHLAGESLCTIKVPAQGPRSGMSYENQGSGSTADVLIKFNVTSLTYEVEGPKLQCGSSGSNGEYTGSTTEIAKNEKGEQIGWMVG